LGAGCEDWFEVIAAGDVVTAKKPAADIYLYALKKLGLHPSACLAIEDSEIGLRAARGAAIPTLITICEYTRHQNFSGALLVLDQLGEPNAPFTVLQGERPAKTYVDLDLLRELHRRALSSRPHPAQ
jgi:beta-phosphoglucomutase-like phosphatase (HAD superfamily)